MHAGPDKSNKTEAGKQWEGRFRDTNGFRQIHPGVSSQQRNRQLPSFAGPTTGPLKPSYQGGGHKPFWATGFKLMTLSRKVQRNTHTHRRIFPFFFSSFLPSFLLSFYNVHKFTALQEISNRDLRLKTQSKGLTNAWHTCYSPALKSESWLPPGSSVLWSLWKSLRILLLNTHSNQPSLIN